MKFAKILLLLMGIVLISGCIQQTGKIGFETLEKGYYSGCKNAGNYFINDKTEFEKIWSLTFGTRLPLPTLPEINFSENSVIATCMGEFPTGGYGIEIKEITEYGDKVVVALEKTYPKPGSVVTQAFTQPYHFVKTERIDKPVEFEVK